MRPTDILPYQFPTTTIFLDDNHDFLLNFVLQLDENVAYRLFESPIATLEYINEKTSPTRIPHVEGYRFYQHMYNPERFAEISILVVDYAMPGMDGLTLCRRIEKHPIKKILLTGKADEKLALSALDEGLINRYVDKSHPSASQQIIKAIHELQQEYFQSVTSLLNKSGAYTPPPCLTNTRFAELFNELCHSNNIIEYYLIDASGSFILIDEAQKPIFLLVKSQDEMHALAKKAANLGLNTTIVEELKAGKKIPCAINFDQSEWTNHLVIANSLPINDQNYYYALSSSLTSFPFNATDLYSYHSYLEALDAEDLLNE